MKTSGGRGTFRLTHTEDVIANYRSVDV